MSDTDHLEELIRAAAEEYARGILEPTRDAIVPSMYEMSMTLITVAFQAGAVWQQDRERVRLLSMVRGPQH